MGEAARLSRPYMQVLPRNYRLPRSRGSSKSALLPCCLGPRMPGASRELCSRNGLQEHISSYIA